MKILCEVCEKAEAQVLCCSDEAVLCKPCDIKVHEANKIFQRHHRVALQKNTASGVPLCDICQERKGYFFCLEDKALLCNECDEAIHICNSHQRFLLSGVQVSDQSLTETSECSTSFSSEAYQIQSKASLNSQYSCEETEAGNSGSWKQKWQVASVDVRGMNTKGEANTLNQSEALTSKGVKESLTYSQPEALTKVEGKKPKTHLSTRDFKSSPGKEETTSTVKTEPATKVKTVKTEPAR